MNQLPFCHWDYFSLHFEKGYTFAPLQFSNIKKNLIYIFFTLAAFLLKLQLIFRFYTRKNMVVFLSSASVLKGVLSFASCVFICSVLG